MQEQWNDTL